MTRYDSSRKWRVHRLAELGPQQQLEGGVGGLEGPAVGLQVLDPLDRAADHVGPGGQVHAELPALELDRCPPGHLGDEDAHVVADQRRVHVVVEVRADLDRAGVQARLVGEGRHPDVRLLRVGRLVGDLRDGVRDAHHLRQAALGQDPPAHLQLQVADHREQVGVAGALAVAVRGALHVGGAGVHCGQRVGHRAAGVVLRVHADPEAGPLDHLAHHPADAHRQHAAVGVAEHADVGAGGERGLQHAQPVVPVVPVAVEEVLAVQEHPPPLGDQEADGVGDHGEVLLRGGAQRLVHVPQVGLGDQADHRGLRVPQREHLRVGGGPGAGLAGRAEGDQLRVPQRQLGAGAGEELGVLGQRARPAALDEADAELVEQPGHRELVADREGHALALRAVAQGGVVDVERVVEHRSLLMGLVFARAAHPHKEEDPPRMREVCALAGESPAR